MKRLALIKGLSYSIEGFSCQKGKPFDVEDSFAEQLMRTGRFEELEQELVLRDENAIPPATSNQNETQAPDPATQNTDAANDPEYELTASKVSKMKNDELITLASEKNISLEGCNKHDEYVERINGSLGLVDFSKLGLE